MNQTIHDLKTRRSIRKFKDEQISDEDLKTILETGTYAPTGRGGQSPKIVVIQDEEKIKELSAWNRSFFPVEVPDDLDPFYGAKTLLIVLADSEMPTYVEDGSSVLTVLVNAAHAVGAKVPVSKIIFKSSSETCSSLNLRMLLLVFKLFIVWFILTPQ